MFIERQIRVVDKTVYLGRVLNSVVVHQENGFLELRPRRQLDFPRFDILDGVLEEDYDVRREGPGMRAEILQRLLLHTFFRNDALGLLLNRHLELCIELDHQVEDFSPVRESQLLVSFSVHEHGLLRRDVEGLLPFIYLSFDVIARFVDRGQECVRVSATY